MFLMLVIFPPVGIYLMWRHKKFNVLLRIVLTVIPVLFLIGMFGGDSSETPAGTSSDTRVENAPASQTQTEEEQVADKESVDVEKVYTAIDEYLESGKKSDLKIIQKGDKELVAQYLHQLILDTVDTSGSLDSLIEIHITEYRDLYTAAFSESRPELDQSVELALEMKNLAEQKEQIEDKYPYPIADMVGNLQYGTYYVAYRLGYTNSDGFMGEILNEVGRALSDSESEWVATNAESFLGLDTPGENYYVLASSLLNPFSSSGAYSLTVYYTSRPDLSLTVTALRVKFLFSTLSTMRISCTRTTTHIRMPMPGDLP